METKKGWFKQPTEHALAAKGIETKQRTETLTRVPRDPKPLEGYNTNSTSTNERIRVMNLFADYNLVYNLDKSFNNNGIYITKDEAYSIMRKATPNGCGSFDPEKIHQLGEAFEPDARFMIKRDDDGGVMVLAKGTPLTHPGAIREWVNASCSTIDDNNIITYKWDAAPRLPGEISILKWAEEIKSGKTKESYEKWVGGKL